MLHVLIARTNKYAGLFKCVLPGINFSLSKQSPSRVIPRYSGDQLTRAVEVSINTRSVENHALNFATYKLSKPLGRPHQQIRPSIHTAKRPLTREEYVQKHKPPVEFQPWSAPAFDDRTVQSQPEQYCMASGTTEQDTTCTCVTERGTRAKISIPVCVVYAWRSHATARPTIRIAHHVRNRSRVRITRLVASPSPRHLARLSRRHMRWSRSGNAPRGRFRKHRLTRLASRPPPNHVQTALHRGCRGSASHALTRPRPMAHVDHIGGLGAGTGITDAQPPFSANSEDFGKVDHAGFRRGGSRGGRSRSFGQVCASLGHHQPPFPRNVAGQRPPGHIAGFQLVTFRGEHVPSLEAETGPRAG